MAFPQVAASAAGMQAVAAMAHPITMPEGSGGLLAVIFSADGNPAITAAEPGWTKLPQRSQGSIVTGAVFWKHAAAGDALTLVTPAAKQSSHVSLRITGAASIEGTSVAGSSADSDAPGHAAGAARDHLWIATRSGDASVQVAADPAGYGNRIGIAGGTNGATTAVAFRPHHAASEDPAAWGVASEQWVCFTLAAVPIAAAAGSISSTEAPDTAAAAGAVAWPPVSGALAAGEAADVAAIAGLAPAQGWLGTSEEPDIAAILGGVPVIGGLGAGEGSDIAAILGAVVIAGGLEAADAPDRVRATGAAVLRPANIQTAPRPAALSAGRRRA